MSTPSSILALLQIIRNGYMNDHTLYDDQDQGATSQASIETSSWQGEFDFDG
jgi:hypothetical protein